MSSKNVNITDFRKQIGGKLIDPQTYSFEQIESKTALGKTQYWNIIVRLCYESADKTEDEEGNHPADQFVNIQDSWFDSKTELPKHADGRKLVGWYKAITKLGTDGKVKKSPPTYVREGKNIGKANATNVFTQTLRDALSKYTKHNQKSTELGDIDGNTMYPPMLAQNLQTINTKPNYGTDTLYAQYKFNGVRVVATLSADNKSVVMYSRSRKTYPGFDHIKKALLPVLLLYLNEYNQRLYLDGEVYKHGVPLQVISGTARRELDGKTATADPNAVQLEYHIYDLFVPAEPTLTQDNRFDILDNIFENLTGEATDYVKSVKRYDISSKESLDALYKLALSEGYEGVMLRLDKPYEYSYNDRHSANLLKYKPTLDGEFKIIDYTSGSKGKSEGTLMFTLEANNPAKTQFTINLGMEIEERKELFKKMSMVEPNGKSYFENHYKGKLLTVLYDELSSEGVPVRARTDGIVVRDYE